MLACCVSILGDTRRAETWKGKRACVCVQLTKSTKARTVTLSLRRILEIAPRDGAKVVSLDDAIVFFPSAKVDKSTDGI